MTIAETEQVITDVFNKINAGSYFRSTTEIQTAASQANMQLYQKFRGNMVQYQKNSPKAVLNFGETTITLDSLVELYRTLFFNGDPLVVFLANETVDLVETLDVSYVSGTTVSNFYGAKILPPNQFSVMIQNKVIPPANEYPVSRFSRLIGADQWQEFEIYPAFYFNVKATVIILPKPPEFTLADSGGAIPIITVTVPFKWTPEKIPALVNLMIENLGFTLQNGVLIQGAASQLQQQL